MKRCILLTVLVIASMWAIEITALGGGNHQKRTMEDGDIMDEGTSGHSGLLVGMEFSPFSFPLTIGGETGILFHRAQYESPIYFQDEWGIVYDTVGHFVRFDNLVFPSLLKGTIKPLKNLRFGIGAGLSVSYPLSGRWWVDYETDEFPTKHTFKKDDLPTYWGWQVKGEVGIRLFSKLWVKPSITSLFESKKDWVNRSALFFSIGLALKI